MTATSAPARPRVFSWLAAILLGLLCTSHPVVRAQVTPYTFYQINGGFSPAMDVNDDGIVVGWWFGPPVSPDPNTESMGYVWTRATGARAMITNAATVRKFPRHTPVNDPTATLRINGTGMIAGVGCLQGCGNSGTQAAIWNSSQGLVFLGSFDNNVLASAAAGVNDAGQVVGYSWGGGYNNSGPFIWSAADGLQPLPGFDGLNGYATGINNDGVVVGAKGTGSRSVAFVWSAVAGLTDIPDVPGAMTSFGLAINDSGVVVGHYLAADHTYRVFRWSATSGTEDLNAPAGSPELLDINNAGDIVATIYAGAGGPVPYLYQNGTWTNLNDLMPSEPEFTLQYVEAINNNGWIVGAGTTTNGSQLLQGFVLIPPIDGTAPVVTAPAPIHITATEASGATGTASVALAAFLGGGSATDNDDPNPDRLAPQLNDVDATYATLFSLGTSTVTFGFRDASGNVGTATSQVSVAPPTIDVVKTATPTTYNAVGQVITYGYTVTNTSNEPLSAVSLTDDKLGPIGGCATASLAPGAAMLCSATHSITQADLEAGAITNVATGLGHSGSTPVTDTDTKTITAPKSGTIGDFVWRDFNKNGLQDAGETGIAGVVVNLSGAATATTTTTASGSYQFTGLGAGYYTVTIPTAPAGLVATTSNVGGAAAGNNSNGSPAPVTLATNASENLTIDFGYADKTNPVCSVYGSASPPYMTYQDSGSGIVRLDVTTNLNTNYRVIITPTPSAFSPLIAYSTPQGFAMPTGQVATYSTPVTSQIKVSAYRIISTKSSQLAVKATDRFGNTVTCDPVETTVTKLKHEKGNQIFTAIPYDEHIVTIENGNPGLRALDVIVNGVEFKVKKLADGATRVIDVKSAMHRRRDNVIELVPRGKKGDTADITIGPEEP